MLIRTNPHRIYSPRIECDRRGLIIVTRRYIIATGVFARCWS